MLARRHHIRPLAKNAAATAEEENNDGCGSRVRLPTMLSTRQKIPKKQTKSLQRRERRKCATSRRMQRNKPRLQFVAASYRSSKKHKPTRIFVANSIASGATLLRSSGRVCNKTNFPNDLTSACAAFGSIFLNSRNHCFSGSDAGGDESSLAF
jgi:hypothetical protein